MIQRGGRTKCHRTKCHGQNCRGQKCYVDKMSLDKMSRTKCHGQKVVDKMAWSKCRGQNVLINFVDKLKWTNSGWRMSMQCFLILYPCFQADTNNTKLNRSKECNVMYRILSFGWALRWRHAIESTFSVAYASWNHWSCGRTQYKAATINQLAWSSYSLYVQLLWYPIYYPNGQTVPASTTAVVVQCACV